MDLNRSTSDLPSPCGGLSHSVEARHAEEYGSEEVFHPSIPAFITHFLVLFLIL